MAARIRAGNSRSPARRWERLLAVILPPPTEPPDDLDLPPLALQLGGQLPAAAQSGRFASLDEAMAEAASLLVQRLNQEQAQAKPMAASPADAPRAEKPIWEEILEATADIPDEVWDKLPSDLAEQHNHYIYGTPKRPTSP